MFKSFILSLLFVFLSTQFITAQVGINTADPKTTLDVESVNNMGMTMPRVSSIEDVFDKDGNPSPPGTMVFDLSRKSVAFFDGENWLAFSINSAGQTVTTRIDTKPVVTGDFIKAPTAASSDEFGEAIALSADGNYLAIGHPGEDANTSNAGAVQIYKRISGDWTFQATVAPAVQGNNDQFGFSISLDSDGDTLAVGVPFEDSAIGGVSVMAPSDNNNMGSSGAVYIFVRIGDVWSQEAYIKSAVPNSGDLFGQDVDLSGDGNTFIAGIPNEDIGGSNYGAVEVYTRTGSNWSQQQVITADNPGSDDQFGFSVSISTDSSTIIAGAVAEDGNGRGVNSGTGSSNNAGSSGAAYIYVDNAGIYQQTAYLKSFNSDAGDLFGRRVDITGDGSMALVSAHQEDGSGIGVNPPDDNNSNASGAVYLFTLTNGTWTQTQYFKASNTESSDFFGFNIVISGDGTRVLIGATRERSNGTGINPPSQENNSIFNVGAVYLLEKTEFGYGQKAYIKASNSGNGDEFGSAVSLSGIGSIIAVGAHFEDSSGNGINPGVDNNNLGSSGAVYTYEIDE